jgi:4-amino-4-deoxy-L-arabinose transferase-like glycosyltransferase
MMLAAVVAVFLAWHVPLMYRTAAGQDEEHYGIVGVAIHEVGIPRIPYIPSRDPETVDCGIDVAAYTLPPLSFYLEALVHLVLGDGLGQARMASALEGLGAVTLVYALAWLWFRDRRGALLGAAMLLFSRAFFFPATRARPDMATAVFGLLALWCVTRYQRDPRRRWLAAGGVAAGLTLLCHPWGIVPVLELGLLLLVLPGRAQDRLARGGIFGTFALGAFALWLPLIALHPDLFWLQFSQNVLARAGPGLGRTLLAPGSVLAFHFRQVVRYVTPFQAGLYALGMGWAWVRARRDVAGRTYLFHVLFATLLLFLLMGRHLNPGYYAYPAALASISVGMVTSAVMTWVEQRWARDRPRLGWCLSALIAALLALALLPGSGVRTLLAHVHHWDRPDYDVRAFSRAIMSDIPPDARTAVGPAFVLEFYLAERPVVAAMIEPLCYDFRSDPYEFAVFGRLALSRVRFRVPGLVLVKTYGDRQDPHALYAELYRRAPGAHTRPVPAWDMPQDLGAARQGLDANMIRPPLP